MLPRTADGMPRQMTSIGGLLDGRGYRVGRAAAIGQTRSTTRSSSNACRQRPGHRLAATSNRGDSSCCGRAEAREVISQGGPTHVGDHDGVLSARYAARRRDDRNPVCCARCGNTCTSAATHQNACCSVSNRSRAPVSCNKADRSFPPSRTSCLPLGRRDSAPRSPCGTTHAKRSCALWSVFPTTGESRRSSPRGGPKDAIIRYGASRSRMWSRSTAGIGRGRGPLG